MADVAFGFISLENQMSQRVSEVGFDTINEAIVASVAEWNRQTDELLDSFVVRVNDIQLRYRNRAAHTLQPLDQWGIPLPVRGAAEYTIGFPIQGAGIAWGTNRVSRALMTVQEANEATLDMLRADADWLSRHIIAQLLYKGEWTFEDPLKGDVTVKPLANGDAQSYVLNNSTLVTAHNHYLAQTAAIADATNPFPTIYTHLTHHAGNTGPVVAHVPTANVEDVMGLDGFVESDPDPDIILGPGNTEERLARTGQEYVAFGDRIVGKVNRTWIVEWSRLPDNFILAHMPAADPALGMREYDAAELKGLQQEVHSPDGARVENRYIRYAGFGTRNRVAALAYQVEGNDTTYDNPTGYTEMPLPV